MLQHNDKGADISTSLVLPEDSALANVGAFLQYTRGNETPVRSSLCNGWLKQLLCSDYRVNWWHDLHDLRGKSIHPKILDILAPMLPRGDPRPPVSIECWTIGEIHQMNTYSSCVFSLWCLTNDITIRERHMFKKITSIPYLVWVVGKQQILIVPNSWGKKLGTCKGLHAH
jgi:hypothetical protein